MCWWVWQKLLSSCPPCFLLWERLVREWISLPYTKFCLKLAIKMKRVQKMRWFDFPLYLWGFNFCGSQVLWSFERKYLRQIISDIIGEALIPRMDTASSRYAKYEEIWRYFIQGQGFQECNWFLLQGAHLHKFSCTWNSQLSSFIFPFSLNIRGNGSSFGSEGVLNFTYFKDFVKQLFILKTGNFVLPISYWPSILARIIQNLKNRN